MSAMKPTNPESELTWICAIAPTAWNDEVVGLCRSANKNLALAESVFKFPLHISIKKSFTTSNFEAVRKDLTELVRNFGPIHIRTTTPAACKRMIWIPVKPEGDLLALAANVNAFLGEAYGIPVHPFDRDFEPHVTLFNRGPEAAITEMVARLEKRIAPAALQCETYVIGSSADGDTFVKTEQHG